MAQQGFYDLQSDIGELGRAIQGLLRYQGELGLVGLDVSPDLLAHRPATPAVPPTQTAEAEVAPAAQAREEAARLIARLSEPSAREPVASSGPRRAVRGAASSPALQAIRDDLGDCTRCKLCKGRTTLVFGVGNPKARLMFVGEGPGRDEDLLGEPFVGAAGQLLDRMIAAMGLKRSDVYIANIVKCRPPKNRDPEPDEIEQCEPFLVRQIEAVNPEVIVSLGRIATQTLLRDTSPISRQRGTWRTYQGRPLLPTFHPAYLLRTPGDKKLAWADLQQVMHRLGLKVQKT